jgi:hypothetical protein
MSRVIDLESVTSPLAVGIERGAAMVGVTPRHFRKQLDTEGGPIRTVRMGNRVLIPVDELRNYLKPAAQEIKARVRRQRRGK